ncbi:hypothetical protein A3962_05395 [Meiothermus taiwanensis]|nr:hypothetical protein A3962_05395 [Meiothermus taiwanensis]
MAPGVEGQARHQHGVQHLERHPGCLGGRLPEAVPVLDQPAGQGVHLELVGAGPGQVVGSRV